MGRVPGILRDTSSGGVAVTEANVIGLSAKASCRLATAAALPSNTYLAGVLTGVALAALTVDGVVVVAGDRILVKNEATAANNGIYVVSATGSGIAAYVLTRASDMNEGSEFPGAFSFVLQGTANAGTGWICLADPDTAFVVGTTACNWTEFSGASSQYGATLLIAANDSSTKAKAQADYLCDGIADEVQINQAIVALRTIGGTVHLAAGTYTLAAAVNIDADRVTLEGEAYGFWGIWDGANGTEGPGASKLKLPASGSLNVIEISRSTSDTESRRRGITIRDLYLFGNDTSGRGIYGISSAGAIDQLQIERVFVHRCGIGMDLYADGGTIRQSTVMGCTQDAIVLKAGTLYTIVTDNKLADNTAHGINIAATVMGTIVANNQIIRQGAAAAKDGILNAGTDTIITGNLVKLSGRWGVNNTAATRAIVDGNDLITNKQNGTGGAIQVDSTSVDCIVGVNLCGQDAVTIDAAAVSDKFVSKTVSTGGDIGLNSNGAYTNVDTNLDIVLPAKPGDRIEVWLSGLTGNEGVELNLNVFTIVSAAPVNGFVAGTSGVPAWIGVSGGRAFLGASVVRTLVSGDISAGTVTLRLRGKTDAASAKTIYRNAAINLSMYARNLDR